MEAKPKAWFSNDYIVQDRDARRITLDCSNWREKAEIEINGLIHTLGRDGLTGPFFCKQGDKVLATARKPSAFSSRLEMEFEGQVYKIEKKSAWRNDFLIRQGGRTVGTIRRRRWYSRIALIDLPKDWSLPLRIFVFWLVLVIWRREDAAS